MTFCHIVTICLIVTVCISAQWLFVSLDFLSYFNSCLIVTFFILSDPCLIVTFFSLWLFISLWLSCSVFFLRCVCASTSYKNRKKTYLKKIYKCCEDKLKSLITDNEYLLKFHANLLNIEGFIELICCKVFVWQSRKIIHWLLWATK